MRKRFSERKYAIITVVLVAIAVAAIAVGVAMNLPEAIGDEYFESDETKLVLSLNKDAAAFVSGEYEPEITRTVYFVDGERVTGMRVFFEYDDETKAREADGQIGTMSWAVGRKLNGKYIIFEVGAGMYDKLSVEEVRDGIEGMRAAGGTVD